MNKISNSDLAKKTDQEEIEDIKNKDPIQESVEDNKESLKELLDSSDDASEEDKELIDVLDKLDEPEKSQIERYLVRREVFKGPLPHPNHVKLYYDIDPQFARDIFDMAIRDQEIEAIKTNANIDLQKGALKYSARDNLLGAIFAFLTIIFLLGSGIILLLFDNDLAGYGTIALAAAGIAKLFLFDGRSSERKNQDGEDA